MKRLMMKAALALCALMSTLTLAAEDIVYVVRLNDEVDAKMARITRRACDNALDRGASLFVVHLNTYGGAVDAADSIRTALMRLPIPTVAFVDPNAASAGALIALACDSVYMSPGASMGASAVVGNDGMPMPEKYQSYMKAIMRSTAERHGKYLAEDSSWRWRRDPAIAESMVDPLEVTSFTASEAVEHGYAEGVASSVDEAVAQVLPAPRRMEYFEPTATDHILGFLANAVVRAVLIMLIVGGIYMEMHSPGLGFAGAVAFVAAVLFFLPMIVEGTMAPWVVILFIIGVVLLALEIFVIPGFGVAGVAGIVAILASIVGGMLNKGSLQGAYAVDIVTAVTITSAGIFLATAAAWFLTSKYGPKMLQRVTSLQADQKISEGYIGVDTSVAKFIGHKAIAATPLRPSGKILIGTTEYDAVSLTGYIDEGHHVVIVKFENAQLYVRPVDEAKPKHE